MAETQPASQKQSFLQKDWTKGPILRNLLLLSWPMVVMETLFVISQVVDMIWIGRLGSAAVAGVGIANILTMMISSADFGIIAGVRAMISRHVGSGDILGARRIAGQAFVIGVIWGVLIIVGGLAASEFLMSMFEVESEVVTQGLAYLRVFLIGWVSMEVLLMGLYTMQSSGDSLSPMKLELTMRIIHITLCPFLVLGIWIFPDMGVAGAALSNVISQVIGSVLGLWILFTGRTRIKMALSDFRVDPKLIWRMLKIGIPALVMNLQRNIGNLVLTWLIAPFGTIAIAAHSLASRVEMFIFMPAMGLGSGAGVLVGQNLGAGQPDRAEKSAWRAIIITELFFSVCGVGILIWANSIMKIFSNDPELIALGGTFLRIAVAAYIAMALATVMQFAIASAGDTLPNMIISMVSIWAIQLPLAYALAKMTGLGVYGIRWAIVAATIALTIATITYFRMGRWKRKKV